MDPELDRSLSRFREVLEERFGDDLITLAAFGSRVRGQATPESDLDIVLVIRGLRASASRGGGW